MDCFSSLLLAACVSECVEEKRCGIFLPALGLQIEHFKTRHLRLDRAQWKAAQFLVIEKIIPGLSLSYDEQKYAPEILTMIQNQRRKGIITDPARPNRFKNQMQQSL
jgi:hypothetical protein